MAKLNVANRSAYLGDNLPVLRGINSNSVDCIYIDPPFNKKIDLTSPINKGDRRVQFEDNWRTPTEPDKLARLEEAVRQSGQASDLLRELLDAAKHDTDPANQNHNYLAMMAVRLVECRRILKPTGALILHCDDTMSHWLKLLLDALFSEKSFRNEIIWNYDRWSSKATNFPRTNDKLLLYGKTEDFKPRKVMMELSKRQLENIKRGYYCHVVQGVKRAAVYDRSKISKETFAKWEAEGRRVVDEKIPEGRPVNDVWSDIPSLARAPKRERQIGYATQKPVALIERVILGCTDEGNVVLDCFAGSCTTAEAAENLNRHWIIVDKSAEACNIARSRLSDLIAGDVKCTTRPPTRTDHAEARKEARAVYIITDEKDPGWIKVGIAKDPEKRLEGLRTGRRRRADLQIAYVVRTPKFREAEKHIHHLIRNDHEWVKATVEEVKLALAEFLE